MITDNYKSVLKDIENTAKNAERKGDEITLIAVSKTHFEDKINPVLSAGHRVFGENKVQEALQKWTPLKSQYPDVELHLIGGLQTNKVKEAVSLFDVIEVVDREKLAKKISSEVINQNKKIECYVQVNTGKEDQKSGVMPEDTDDFISYCRDELKLSITGLMCIPPFDEEPSPHFALLKKIARRNKIDILSMGMSSDYQAAIELGATHVRIGSAIFGDRNY